MSQASKEEEEIHMQIWDSLEHTDFGAAKEEQRVGKWTNHGILEGNQSKDCQTWPTQARPGRLLEVIVC